VLNGTEITRFVSAFANPVYSLFERGLEPQWIVPPTSYGSVADPIRCEWAGAKNVAPPRGTQQDVPHRLPSN